MKNNIKLYRAKNNLTQADLATLSQVSRQTINSIESGKYVPSCVLALKIAQNCNTDIHQLFELEASDWGK